MATKKPEQIPYDFENDMLMEWGLQGSEVPIPYRIMMKWVNLHYTLNVGNINLTEKNLGDTKYSSTSWGFNVTPTKNEVTTADINAFFKDVVGLFTFYGQTADQVHEYLDYSKDFYISAGLVEDYSDGEVTDSFPKSSIIKEDKFTGVPFQDPCYIVYKDLEFKGIQGYKKTDLPTFELTPIELMRWGSANLKLAESLCYNSRQVDSTTLAEEKKIAQHLCISLMHELTYKYLDLSTKE